MSKFLETYGVAIFTLVLVAILIAFAGPLGMKIKNATTTKVSQTEEIGSDEVYVATTGRPKPPKTAVDKVYCIYYDDGELTISQNKIEPESGRTVVQKGFYRAPMDCTQQMTTVCFVGAVKPKSCQNWFNFCQNLTEIKNIKYLYTNECTNMNYMFRKCSSLTSLDLSGFDTSNVTTMVNIFESLNMKSLNISNFDLSNTCSLQFMFEEIKNLDVLILGDLKFSDKTNVSKMFYTNMNANGVRRIQKVYSSQEVKDKFCTNNSYGASSTWWQQRGVEDWIVQ